MRWSVHAAAVTGHSHIDGGLPCQDAFAYRCVGDVLIAAVCDGAGSAARSDAGSNLLAREVVERLAMRAAASPQPLDAVATQAVLDEVVGAARAMLEQCAAHDGAALSEYAATLVGVVADGEGGVFFHVGDGVAVAESRDVAAAPVVSPPENGEYANETYFVTGEEWRAHLRLTPLPAMPRRIVLMSDGCAPFAMTRGNAGLHGPFIDPVARWLAQAAEADGCRALGTTLADPRIDAITSDDKTLLVAQWL
jgi:hypothetical protein